MRTFFIGLMLTASTALASANYPGDIQTKYGLANFPAQSCLLCHATAVGGSGTATSKMAVALRARGLVGGANTMALNMALDTLATDMVDSDGDGVTDVAELMAGTDPNVVEQVGMDGGTGGGGGGGGAVSVPALKFGCGANVAPELFFVLALVPLVRRRIARRR